MRVTALHVLPSEDELITISFDGQPVRKRQSDQTTNTLPAPSIAAEGRLGLRNPPATKWLLMPATAWLLPQLAPPFVKRNNHRAIRLHHRFTAKPARVIRGSQSGPPGLSASLDTLIRTSPVP